MEIYKATINQPSTKQPHHELHMINCIVEDDGQKYVRVHFTTGNIHSMLISRICFNRVHI